MSDELEIYLENTQTGELHQRDAAGRSHESCNLDDARKAGHLREITDLAEVRRILTETPERGCGHCKPKPPAEEPA